MANPEWKDKKVSRTKPATTPDAREKQLIAMAIDQVEEQLRTKTASSQVLTHFLKRASTKERLEQEIMEEQKKLITAKTESIQSAKTMESLYADAIQAMQSYRGVTKGDGNED